MKPDFNELIPELRDWNGGAGISIDRWIRIVGTTSHALGFGRLFWPEFTLHEGHILFSNFGIESFRGFATQTGGDRRAPEAAMNHRHLASPFAESEGTAEQFLYLGRLMQDMWQAKLARDFPGERIVVTFHANPADDPLEWVISFAHV